MSIIAALPWFAGEVSGFDFSDAAVIDATNGNTFDAAYARCSIDCGSIAAVAYSPKWATASTLWTHGTLTWSNGYYVASPAQPILFVYHAGVAVAQIMLYSGDQSTFTLTVQTLQGGVMTTIPGSVILTQAVRQTFDLQVTGGAGGSAALYVGGFIQCVGTGLNHAAWAGGDQIVIRGLNIGGAYVPNSTFWSEMICDSVSTIGRRLLTLKINTNSAVNTGWTGSVTDVNEIGLDDGTFISAGAAALTSTFYQSGLSLGTKVILALGVGARARVQPGGPPNLKLALRVAGANYVSAPVALTDGFQATFNSWTLNPATSAPWTDLQAQTSEQGVQSSS